MNKEKLIVWRSGIWYSGTYINETKLDISKHREDSEYLDNDDFDDIFYQNIESFEDLNYEIENHHNNPFHKTEAFYYKHSEQEFKNDCVYVYLNYKNKNELLIGINLSDENSFTYKDCNHYIESQTKRIKKLESLFNDVLKIFKERYVDYYE